MPSNGPDSRKPYEVRLNEHYGEPNLGEDILEQLRLADKDVDELSREDIKTFDEFHIRGREATRELASLAAIDAGSRVLDIGCGVGGPARTLAAEFGCDVTGIDLVEEYCRAAEAFTDRVGLSDAVSFQSGDALDLPFEEGLFDVVWFQHTLMNIEATDIAIGEANRVLGSTGKLAVYEICDGGGGPPRFPVPWAPDASLNHLVTPNRLREIIIDRGFDEVAWKDVSEPSLEWFRGVVDSMGKRPADAPPPLGLNLLMGEETPAKAKNVVRSLEEKRIAVVQGVFERVA